MLITCTVQRDVVHAGYLALALIAFRQQQQQQQVLVGDGSRSSSVKRLAAGRVLSWLQVFNFCVMAAMLIYQVRIVFSQSHNTSLAGHRNMDMVGACRRFLWYEVVLGHIAGQPFQGLHGILQVGQALLVAS